MAPEVCHQATGVAGYSGKKADIWSLGVTVVEMMMGTHPWQHLNAINAMNEVGQSVGCLFGCTG